jgi:L-fuculose-phosphate aldolase
MDDLALRNAIIHYARGLHADGLTVANSGNISARNAPGYLITPSGVSYETLTPPDIVQLDMQGKVLDCRLLPSSEWRFHRDIYLHKPRINAIVHAHSPSATALACLRQPVPAFHYMVSLFGGTTIPCAAYATFGTQALSDNVVQALEGHNGCLMANHGMLTIAESLPTAYRLAQELESLCAQYSEARQLGEVYLLDAEEMAAAKAAFAQYGQKKM